MAKSLNADTIPADEAKTLPGLLLERARRTPDGAAYLQYIPASDTWVETTWRETAIEVGRWQEALRREGLAPGDRVAVQMANRREWVWFDMAAMGLGLVTVPMYTEDRPDNVRYILKETDARLLLVDTAERLAALAPIANTLAELGRLLLLGPAADHESPAAMAETPVDDWLPPAGDTPAAVDESPGPDALATIVYTSGTTGAPKGVMLSHRNILWDAEAVQRTNPARVTDRFLSFLPLSHTLERTGGYYLPMMAGASVAYARSIQQLPEDLVAIRPTVLIAVPRIFERVYGRVNEKLATGSSLSRRLFQSALTLGYRQFEHAQGRAPWAPGLLLAPVLDRLVGAKIRGRLGGRLRVAVTGGAPISTEIARFFIGLGVPLVQGYGLTEASPVVTVSPLENNVPASIGLPLPGLELRVGPQDELQVRSPSVMMGYWRHPEATQAVLDPDGWLHTGDQGRIDEGNHVFITGRIKELLVLSNGEKVPPSDLELAIASDALFSQVLVIGEGRPFLSALTVLDPDGYDRLAREKGLDPDPSAARGSPALEEILVERIAERLRGFPGYAKIHRVGVIEQPWTIEDGTMTPTMKLKRARILERYHQDVTRLYEKRA